MANKHLDRFYDSITKQIVGYLEEYPYSSPREISDNTKISWVTVNKYLVMLKDKGHVMFRKTGKVVKWYLVAT